MVERGHGLELRHLTTFYLRVGREQHRRVECEEKTWLIGLMMLHEFKCTSNPCVRGEAFIPRGNGLKVSPAVCHIKL
jgi:hypothetical protein